MKYYSLKHYLEVCHIMIMKMVEEKEFMNFFGLSYYEYKSDMDIMMEIAAFFGIIIYVENDHIQYTIVEQTLFEQKYKPCTAFYSAHIAQEWKTYDIKPYYIAIKFLMEQPYIKLDELSDELMCSKSSLRKDMKLARDILLRYDIDVHNYPYYGMKAEGKEFNKRLCLDAIFNYYDTHIIVHNKESVLFDNFFSDFYDRTYEAVSSLLWQSRIDVSQLNRKKLVRYLVVVKQRWEQGIYILDHEMDPDVVHCEEYRAARCILKEILALKCEATYAVNEIMALASYLIVLREYHCDCLYNSYYYLYAKKEADLQRLFHFMTAYMLQRWQIALAYQNKSSLYQVLIPIYLKASFGYLIFKDAKNIGNSYSYTRYPLIKIILKDISERLQEFFALKQKVPFIQIFELSDLIMTCCSQQKLAYEKVNIAVASKNGRMNRHGYYKMLESYIHPRYIYKLTEESDSDVTAPCFHDYQVVVVEQKIYVRLKGKLVRVNVALEDINSIVLESIDLINTYIEKVVIQNFDAKSAGTKEEKNCTKAAATAFVDAMTKKDTYVIAQNKLVVVKANATRTEKLILFAGMFLPKLELEGKEVTSYICVEYPSENMDHKLLNMLLHIMCNDYIVFDDIIRNDDLTTLNRSLKKYI